VGTRRYFGTGGYHTGEKHLVITPSVGAANGLPLAIVCHGSDQLGANYYRTPTYRADLDLLASTGFVVMCIDHGDPTKPDNWGNDTAIDRIDEAITWAEGAPWNCATTRVAVLADSAGGPTALGWAWRNPDRIGACVLRTAVVDVSATHERNALLEALIDAAYDDDWAAEAATHDPMLNTEDIIPIADRVRHYYSTTDGLILPEDVRALADATGIRAIPLGDVEHNADLIYPAIPAHAQAQFIRSKTL
jgi:pimeloyl-ACP methyl ester carboxylesterase